MMSVISYKLPFLFLVSLIAVHSISKVEGKKKPTTSTEIPNSDHSLLVDNKKGIQQVDFDLRNGSSAVFSDILIGAFNLRKFGLPKVQNEKVLEILTKVGLTNK
jgi:hypothetical protein